MTIADILRSAALSLARRPRELRGPFAVNHERIEAELAQKIIDLSAWDRGGPAYCNWCGERLTLHTVTGCDDGDGLGVCICQGHRPIWPQREK